MRCGIEQVSEVDEELSLFAVAHATLEVSEVGEVVEVALHTSNCGSVGF